jgi:DNA-binding beta-propeller fold protein YncE
VVVNPDGTFVYTPSSALAATGGTDVFAVRVADSGLHLHLFVSVVDTATNTVTATIAVGNDPIGVAVSPTATSPTSPTSVTTP